MATQDELEQHEVLHTASIVMQMFDDHVFSTHYVESDPEISAAAQTAFDTLYAFYQLVGARSIDSGDGKDSGREQRRSD